MASNTTNFKMRKPAVTDNINVVTDIDDNLDKIDNLAFMNRPTSTAESPLITWATTMYGNRKYIEVDVPVNFKKQVYLNTFDIYNSNVEVNMWQAICKCKINTDASTSIEATFIYTTGNPMLYNATYAGIFCVFQRTTGTGSSQLQFRWLCGSNINTSDYALGVVEEDEEKYLYIYIRKKVEFQGHVVTCLECHRNYTADQRSYTENWVEVGDDARGYTDEELPSLKVTSLAPIGFTSN